jgi:hypothetical protein
MRFTLVVVIVTVVVLLAGIPTHAFVAGDGKGKPENDCLVGLDGVDPGHAAGRVISCTDCDPSCDADDVGSPNGSCKFGIAVCLNRQDVAGCTPDVIGTVKASPRALLTPADVPVPRGDSAAVCAPVANGVIVDTRKGGREAGKRKIRLLARTRTKPRRKDVDVFHLVCNPRPEGEGCTAGTTTSTTTQSGATTTTTLSATCGNGVVEGTEPCDGEDFGGKTCADIPGFDFISGELGCSLTCNLDVRDCVAPNPTCSESMDDGSCPNTNPQCGASFSGGSGCLNSGLPLCYHSGMEGYRVDVESPVTITLEPDIVGLRVFFAHQTGASGTMTFRDVDGQPVGSPIATNGDCQVGPMPAVREITFPSPVHTIEVTATGAPVWIDTFTVNP